MLAPLIALAAAVCAPAAAPQIGFGDTVRLGCFGNSADHANLDANSYGDACIAYHTRLPQGGLQVEVQIIQYLSPGVWDSSAAMHFLVGDPAVNVYGNGLDTCTKPDVVATDDESFTVVWPRRDRNNLAVGRLEAARIRVRDAAGALLPAPIVESAAPGEGFVVDPLVPSGDAGLMPDLAALPGGVALAVYAAEDSKTYGSAGETYREYSLRLSRVNWSLGAGNAGFVEGPWILANRIPSDNPWWAPYYGGMIVPDVVTDDLENLVVAWEQYWVAGHPGYAGSDLGEIVVRRYEALSSASPRSILDEDHFSSSYYPERHQRRPNLDSTPNDAVNDVLLAWVDQYDWPWHDKVRAKSLHYPTSMATGQSWSDDRFWSNDPYKDEGHPTCGMLPGREIVFATRAYQQRRVLLAASHASLSMFQVPTPVLWPQRAAVRLLDVKAPGGGTVHVLYVAYEGANVDDEHFFRTYFGVFRI